MKKNEITKNIVLDIEKFSKSIDISQIDENQNFVKVQKRGENEILKNMLNKNPNIQLLIDKLCLDLKNNELKISEL